MGYLAVGVGIVLVCTMAYLTVNETAGVVKDVTESTMPKIQNRDQNVYVMRDKDTDDVKCVGRTNDPVRRQKEHKKDLSKNNLDDLEVKFTGLTKTEARIVEQVLISAYTLDHLQNARREIAKGKVDAFAGKMQNIVSIFGGAVEDELLNLMGV